MRRLKLSFLLLLGTLTFGIVGYMFVENMSLFDALYMTIITISTVGFSEIKTLSILGRILTMIIISTGITVGAYTIGTLLRMIIEGEIKKTLGRRKVEKKIAQLKDHFIICGFGRIGKLIASELHGHSKEFVVIENNPEAIVQLENERILYLSLDATEEESLITAGIKNARGIVTAVRSDSDNVFITLTAKGLRPDIFILSRASEEKNEGKLIRAGATKVVSPYVIGGKRMAQVLIRPTVVDFVDLAVMKNDLGLLMEEVFVNPQSSLIGKNLIQSNLRKDYGVIIVLIKKNNGEMIFNPLPNEVLEAKDVLVMLGKKEEMTRLSETI